jgi:hypothetical protein
VQPVPNPTTPQQQTALTDMGITRDHVVNPGQGMTLDAARVAQDKVPTNKFYQLSGYGDQNSIYASAGKDGELNTFSGAGTGKASTGMPSPESARKLLDDYQNQQLMSIASSTPETAAHVVASENARKGVETSAQDRILGENAKAEARTELAAASIEAKKDLAKDWTPVADAMGKTVLVNRRGKQKALFADFAVKSRMVHPDATDEQLAKAYDDYLGAV